MQETKNMKKTKKQLAEELMKRIHKLHDFITYLMFQDKPINRKKLLASSRKTIRFFNELLEALGYSIEEDKNFKPLWKLIKK